MRIKGFYFYLDVYIFQYVYQLIINVPTDRPVQVDMLHRPFVLALGGRCDVGLVIEPKI